MTKVILYNYQEEAYKKIVEKFKKSSTALVVMATGLGKTILAAFWAGKEIQERKRGLFLCHDTGILDQAVDEFKFVLGDEVKFAKFYGVNGNREEVSLADIVFSSFQTMKNNLDFFGREWFDFVIVDESHHGQASTYKRVINHFNPKKLLGITATPNRMDLKNIREIFGEEVVDISLEEAIAKNWLVPIEYRVITDSLKLDNLKKIIQEVKEKGERPSIQELDRMLFGKLSDIDIVKTTRQYSGDSKRTIVFCRDIKDAEKMSGLFPKSEACHSNKDRECVNKFIEKLRTGELVYLTAVNQLNEGVDVPAAEIIALNRKTSSPTIWSQQIGRGTRKYYGKEKILVLDFVANCGRLIAVKKMVDEIKEIGEKEASGGVKAIHNIESDFIFTDEQIDILELLRNLRASFYPTWQEASEVAMELGII